jgi:hypothetical protein
MDYEEAILLAIGAIGPVVLAVKAFRDRKRLYATWAKVAYVLACIAGFGWGILGLILWPPFQLARQGYFFPLLALKYMFGGMVIGFLISVLIARPYERRRQERHFPKVST